MLVMGVALARTSRSTKNPNSSAQRSNTVAPRTLGVAGDAPCGRVWRSSSRPMPK